MAKQRILIMELPADFHNFNTYFRKPDYEVVAFTATQIPDTRETLPG